MEAEAALRSLKQKIANAPKKPIMQTQKRPSGYNQNKINNMDFDVNHGYNNTNKINNNYSNNKQMYQKPKTTISNKKPAPFGGNPKSNLRSNPKMNNNKFGGGFDGGFGGVFEDNRPLGGGLTADQMEDINEAVTPCPHCGRKFNEISYPKHVKNCQKVFQKKRKAFNTQKQRFVDSEQASLMKMGAMQAKKNPKLNKPKGGIPKWKLQSMEFRAICNPGKANKIRKEMGFGNNVMMNNKMGIGNNFNLKGGKNISKSTKPGGYGGIGAGFGSGIGGGFGSGMGGMDMGGYFPSATPLDYTHCQYCNRNYNEEAYNKHLNGCKRRYEEAQMRNKLSKKPIAKTQIKSSYGKGQINYPMYGANAKKPGKKK